TSCRHPAPLRARARDDAGQTATVRLRRAEGARSSARARALPAAEHRIAAAARAPRLRRVPGDPLSATPGFVGRRPARLPAPVLPSRLKIRETRADVRS